NNSLSFFYIRKNIKLNFNNLTLKKYLFPLFVIILINNINILYTNLDKITLGFYTTPSEVAYYGIGQKVMTVILMIVMTMISVSIPRLSYYLGDNKEEYIKLLNKILKYIACLIFPMSLGIYALKEEIAIFFGGTEYIVASSVVGMFGIRMIVLSYESILSNQVVFLHKKEKSMAVILGVCALANILFKVILIKKYLGLEYNATSAILTTTLAEILIIFLNLFYIGKYLKLKIEIFSKNIIFYIGISLFFIPISKFIKTFKFNYIVTSLTTVVICSFIYLIILVMIKDECIVEVFNKLKIRLKKRN
ncbi:oligosaccharide flippase family protein, partial [Cetobacterium sp.]|uniref:oligosaccharide flippase family protein n=1 Tax=Cetobacterium sp. TaxID=2071632 RepID=UPI003EE5A589